MLLGTTVFVEILMLVGRKVWSLFCFIVTCLCYWPQTSYLSWKQNNV